MENDYQDEITALQNKLTKLQSDFDSLSSEFYKNNFSAQQDFTKKSSFVTRLKVPHYASDPTTAEVGEIIEVGGKLKICSSANTFTIVGTQS
jgi:hypothetical protein